MTLFSFCCHDIYLVFNLFLVSIRNLKQQFYMASQDKNVTYYVSAVVLRARKKHRLSPLLEMVNNVGAVCPLDCLLLVP